jgi:hypothetical protein
MGVADTDALAQLAEQLDGMGIGQGPVVRTPSGWWIPGVLGPDGTRDAVLCLRHTTSLTSSKPMRIHDAGPGGWSEPKDPIDLDVTTH